LGSYGYVTTNFLACYQYAGLSTTEFDKMLTISLKNSGRIYCRKDRPNTNEICALRKATATQVAVIKGKM